MSNTRSLAAAVCACTVFFCGAARAQIAGPSDTVSFDTMPATFSVPVGWRLLQRQGDAAVLAPNINQPEVLVVAHARVYSSVEDFYAFAAETIEQELQAQDVRVVQEPDSRSADGRTTSSARLAARNSNGEPVSIGLDVVIAEDGLGLGLLTLASVATFDEGTAAAEQILQTTRLGPLGNAAQSASGLVGRWVRAAAANSGNRNSTAGGWSSGSNVTYAFHSDGTYSYHYESFASVDVPGLGGLSSDSDEDAGRYFVGDRTITLVSDQGGSETLEYRVVDDQYVQIGNSYFERR